MRKFYLLIAIMLIAIPTLAQLTLLKSGGSTTFAGAGVGNRVIYADFSTGAVGGTDGTVAGTVDIPTSTVILGDGEAVAALNNKIIFAGIDATTGMEIWASDGTIAGTVRLMDINPGAASSNISGSNYNLSVVNGYAYFSANDGTGIRKLYRTNGTIAGTGLVKDLGNVAIGFPFLRNPVGTNLYFTVNGKQLWKSDGTSAGTVMVKDFSPGSTVTFSNMFVGSGSYTYFLANDGVNGMELWRTDGTTAGTIMLENYGWGPADGFTLSSGSEDWNCTASGNMLFFQPANAGAKLYSSNGTPAGTVQVKDLNPGGSGYFELRNAITVLNYFYFVGNGSLFRSDGTQAGTTEVLHFGSGSVDILEPRENLGGDIAPGTFANGNFFIIVDDPAAGKELFVSDGTAAGTFMCKNIAAGSASAFGNDHDYFYTKYKLYIAANNGTNGFELWESDGTSAGTVMTMDIFTGASSSNPEFFGISLSTNRLVLSATNASGRNLYSINTPVVPLPLSLIDFAAQLKGNEVVLNWTTLNEVNTSHFNLQRSMTAQEFLTIGRVTARGGHNAQNYLFTDRGFSQQGILYYRLEMVDADGKLSYSKVVAIKLKTELDFNVRTTGSEIILNLGDQSGLFRIRISDATGRSPVIRQYRISSGEQIRIPIWQLAAGVYYVTVESNGVLQTKQFVR